MNSIERHERRYRRRKATRDARKARYQDFDAVFSYEHLYKSSRKCRLNVSWKGSVQKYLSHEFTNVALTRRKLLDGTYRAMKFAEFDINERGKLRHIKSLHIKDRLVQKCICDYCLIPLIKPKLIYDNAACLKNRGVTFARKRFKIHLSKFVKEHKGEGYILIFDFKSYFDSIPHDGLIDNIRKLGVDDRLLNLYSQLVNDFGADKGVGLGSQISQISAVYYLNELDHEVAEHYYGRYMDDSYLFHENKEYLRVLLNRLIEMAEKKGIKFNMKKTQIIKLSRGFSYLKRHYTIVNGHIREKAGKDSVIRERRKVKRMLNAQVALSAIVESIKSWASHLKGTRSSYQIRKIYKLIGGLK